MDRDLKFFYPLAVVYETDMGGRNAVLVSVSYWKGQGIVAKLTVVNKHADEPGHFSSFSCSPMTDPKENITVEAISRNSDKKVIAAFNHVKGQLVGKIGPVYDALVAFAAKHGLQLADPNVKLL